MQLNCHSLINYCFGCMKYLDHLDFIHCTYNIRFITHAKCTTLTIVFYLVNAPKCLEERALNLQSYFHITTPTYLYTHCIIINTHNIVAHVTLLHIVRYALNDVSIICSDELCFFSCFLINYRIVYHIRLITTIFVLTLHCGKCIGFSTSYGYRQQVLKSKISAIQHKILRITR